MDDARRYVRRGRIFCTVFGVWIALSLMWVRDRHGGRHREPVVLRPMLDTPASRWPSPGACCSGSADCSAPTGNADRSTTTSAPDREADRADLASTALLTATRRPRRSYELHN